MDSCNEIVINSPLDMHLHFRQGSMLELVAPLSAAHFAGGVIMPNLVPPVDSIERLKEYTTEVLTACKNHAFTPYMTLFFRSYTEKELLAVKDHIIGIKLYPAGATTHSEKGVSSISEAEITISLMQDMGIPLLVHGEDPEGFVLDRETLFLPKYSDLASRFPDLKIVMEHITTADAVSLLDQYENLYATVTLQHLLITLDDVVGGLMKPHLFCKPIAKRPEDRNSLLEAALNAHPKLMFGSDSAPHPVHEKECCGCAAGVFTAPIALPMLAELFHHHDKVDKLQAFVSDTAQKVYNIEPTKKEIRLRQETFTIPIQYGNVTPMNAGCEISWNVI